MDNFIKVCKGLTCFPTKKLFPWLVLASLFRIVLRDSRKFTIRIDIEVLFTIR